MKIELTKEERDNLIVFLTRTSLHWEEVPAYANIVAALNKPFLDEINDKKILKKPTN